MLAQLLGMGRKKDPPKDSTGNGGQQELTDPLANRDSSLGPGDTGSAASAQAEAATSAGQQATATALLSQGPPSPLSASSAPLRGPTPNGAGNPASSAAGAQASATGGGFQAEAGCSSSGSGSGSRVPSETGGDATGIVAQEGGSGGAGATTTTAVVQQPLGHKQAFSSEAAAVERGLHLQLGDTDAKTESQLGGQQLEAAKRLRHLLATNKERMVQELLNRGWVPLLLRWLGLAHRPSLQVEALSALTTVAQTTTEHTPLLLKHGAVGTLVSLLKSPSLEMVEQAMWVLGKMAQDSQDGTTTARDAVLQAGVLGPLVRCLEEHPSLLSLQRIGAWSLFNLLDGQPRPTVDVPTVNTVMPAIHRLLMSGDSEVLSHACSGLSHLCDGSAAHIKIVVESGVCKRLVELLDHPSSQVVKPALRTIGNVVCAEDDADYTEAILEAGSVVCLKKLIAHPNREIQKEACWTLSNIAAGSVSQIQSVLDSGAMPQLIKLATSADTESEVRSEAFWVVLNAASCGSDAQIEYLVSQGCVQILSDLLGESSMVMMALEGIERVLSVGDLRVVRNAIASHSHDDQGPRGAGGDHGEEEHCVECASVAAVGAAAAAAAARGGEESGLGGDDAGAYTNPYACMLTPEKIQALEAHKNSAVAKRANRVWARYFVTCAICRGSFSRHGSSATFCTECNCHVCGTCDCTVFHLAYQDKLWEEMEGKEKRGKKAQQAAKKNKKAKKREKKKNAAKELAVEPPSKESKAGGSGGNGGGGGGKNAPGGVRLSHGKKDKTDGSNDENADSRSSVQPSQDLGKKTHTRSDSPHKASSSASTESNSEDEYDPSSPQNAAATAGTGTGTKYGATSSAAPPTTSVAAAIIDATAISVTSSTAPAATAAAAKKSGAARTANATPSKKSPARRPPAVVTPTAPDDSGTASGRRVPPQPEDERGQRRAGKKQGRRDQQPPAAAGQQHGKSLFSALSAPSSSSSASSSSSSYSTVAAALTGKGATATAAAAAVTAAASGVPDDESEQPWVVVGGTGGKRAGATKWNKGQQHQRAANPVPVGAGGGGGGGASSVVWASESSPANVAVQAVTPVRPSTVVSPSPAAAVPRVSPPPFAVPVVPSSAGGGNAWGGTAAAAALKPAAISPQVVPQRPPAGPGTAAAPGPGPGSVWGTSAAVVDSRTKPFLVAAAGAGAGAGSGPPPAVSQPGAPVSASRALGPSANRAGVIGPRPAVAVAVAAATTTTTTAKPVGPSGPPLPAAKALPPAAAATTAGGRVSATVVPGAKSKAGPGVVGGRLAGGAAAPSVQRPAAVGGANGGGLVRTASSGSEALVENEKLVSFLLETGSILALAQRLEEEEDWRLPTPSS